MSEDTAALKSELDALLRDVEASKNRKSSDDGITNEVVDQVTAEAEAIFNDKVTEVPQVSTRNQEFKGANHMGQHDLGNTKTGTLSLDLSGEVSIDLKLNFGNQTVYLSCDDENLLVQLGDGTSFRLPFNQAQHKAA